VSDRIGLGCGGVDTLNNVGGEHHRRSQLVAQAGNNASPCLSIIPPLLDASGSFNKIWLPDRIIFDSRIRRQWSLRRIPRSAMLCCARQWRESFVAPDGEAITADGKTLFIGNGSSTVVVFDLTTNPPNVIANIPTGQSPQYDSGVRVLLRALLPPTDAHSPIRPAATCVPMKCPMTKRTRSSWWRTAIPIPLCNAD